MNQTIIKSLAKKSERGQAIILLAFAFIGLIAMVGLVTDTGVLLIEYGKLKRSVDAAAVAAAQEYRPNPLADPDPVTGVRPLNLTAMENATRTFLQINQINNLTDVVVHTCEDTGDDRPDLCNPDPEGNPIENRKLVEVTAHSDVRFAFLRVLGINSADVVVTSIGEAATIDLVLLMDTSGSMAYATTGDPYESESGDDPIACNVADDCQPMRAIKDVAMEFVDSLIYYGYDRVAVIPMTGQVTGPTDAAERAPNPDDADEVLPLSFDRNVILGSIDNLTVYQPRKCPDTLSIDGVGGCLKFEGSTYITEFCEPYDAAMALPTEPERGTANPSSCPSSNFGNMFSMAQDAYGGSGNPNLQRTDALWVTVMVASGPANTSTPSDPDLVDYPFGYCPQNTWLLFAMPDPKPRRCRDAVPGNERSPSSALVPYTNPLSGETTNISLYDAEDFARDMADNLAASKSPNGVTIYTIGLGDGVVREANGTPAVSCEIETTAGNRPCGEAEYLLTYISRQAGDNLAGSGINHGEYFYSPNDAEMRNIFEIIAQNIATKISE